ncbi:chlorohydrolase [Streptococcus pneumoniae]|uniref:chlorohydrolase n=1 Tax=Streptococcus pneumoniae TaxID=1313 RepID=UPI000B589E28|nr:chlorohydrolase [Streptococcus pneumoniae]SNE86451.1 chlorohydrolase [Streptococcus pneumoniae]
MKIKVQTRKLAAGCSKHCFKVVDGTDEVAQNTVELTKSAQNTVSMLWMELTKSNHTYGKVKLTWFEEIFEKYKSPHNKTHITKVLMNCTPKVRQKKSNFWGAVHSTPDTMRFFNFKDFLQLLLTPIKLF